MNNVDIRKHIYTILLLVLSLVAFGIVMLYSSSGVHAWHTYGDYFFVLKRHLFSLALSVIAMLIGMVLPLEYLQRYAKQIYICVCIILLIVLIPGIGHKVGGARRWFQIGSFSLQPSEFGKIAVILYAADFLNRKVKLIDDFFAGVFPLLLGISIAVGLMLLEPDMGAAVTITAIVCILLFISGIKFKHLSIILGAGIISFCILIAAVSYRRMRLLVFFDPWNLSRDVGYQLVQSQVAIGSGGLFGVGLGKSIQKLFYLPAASTDFIFSIIAEELGFIGSVCLISLYSLLYFNIWKVIRQLSESFNYLLAHGLFYLLLLQTIINIGVCVGVFPTKGLPLPFISYGGSAMVFNFLIVGLIFNTFRVFKRGAM